MEAVFFYCEMSVNFCWTTGHRIPERNTFLNSSLLVFVEILALPSRFYEARVQVDFTLCSRDRTASVSLLTQEHNSLCHAQCTR
jgi:hypothetical protein